MTTSKRAVENLKVLKDLDYGLFVQIIFLRIRMRLNGYTIKSLSAKIGKSRTYVAAILNAEREPYGPSKRPMARFLEWLRDGYWELEEAL